jgi:hypothetical protein
VHTREKRRRQGYDAVILSSKQIRVSFLAMLVVESCGGWIDIPLAMASRGYHFVLGCNKLVLVV